MGGLLMGLSIPYEAIIAYALGLVLLYVVGYLLLVPFKMVLRFIYNGLQMCIRDRAWTRAAR